MKLIKEELTDLSRTDPDEAIKKMNDVVSKSTTSFLETGIRPYRTKSVADRLMKYEADSLRSEMARRQRVPLFDESAGMYLQPGFVLVGGVSGKGKSNVGANLIAGYLKSGGNKPIIAITNEESSDSMYNRVACCMTGLNFYKLKNGTMNLADLKVVKEAVKIVAELVEVVFDGEWDTNVYEDVLSILHYGVNTHVGLIVGDYWQNINSSKIDQNQESFRISKALGSDLKELGKRATMPIVWLVQLSNKEDAEFKERVENDKSLFNHATQVIELVPDFKAKTSTFKVHKDRYGGTQGIEVVCRYEHGIYIPEGGSGETL